RADRRGVRRGGEGEAARRERVRGVAKGDDCETARGAVSPPGRNQGGGGAVTELRNRRQLHCLPHDRRRGDGNRRSPNAVEIGENDFIDRARRGSGFTREDGAVA